MGGKLGGVPKDWRRAMDVYDLLSRKLSPFIAGKSVHDMRPSTVACGSLRRKHEMVGDLDVIVVNNDYDKAAFVEQAFALLGLPDPLTKSKKPRKQTHFIVTDTDKIEVCAGQDYGLQVDLYFCPHRSLGAFMLFLTGSKEFNVWQRQVAIRRGFKLTQWALEGADLTTFDERAICHALGMGYPEPCKRDASCRHEWEDLLWS